MEWQSEQIFFFCNFVFNLINLIELMSLIFERPSGNMNVFSMKS